MWQWSSKLTLKINDCKKQYFSYNIVKLLIVYNTMQKSNDIEAIEKIRPAIYLRVSTEDQWNRYGLDLQKHAIDHFIKTRADYTSDNIPIYID